MRQKKRGLYWRIKHTLKKTKTDKKKNLRPKTTSANPFESQNTTANPHEASVWWFKHAVCTVCLGWAMKIWDNRDSVFSKISFFFSYYFKSGLLMQDCSPSSCPSESHSYTITWREDHFFSPPGMQIYVFF